MNLREQFEKETKLPAYSYLYVANSKYIEWLEQRNKEQVEVLKWIDVKDEMPSKEHAEKNTEFLVKGRFIIQGHRGGTIHKVLRLDDHSARFAGVIRFQEPADFESEKWRFIEEQLKKSE